jgi:TetR/AcrR family fatty acid metabolism transcriptional regulator
MAIRISKDGKGGIQITVDSVHRSLREKQRQERQELILQAAEQVFTEKGYYDISLDEIARRVGIGTATIYSHFSSKEDLMVAAIFERALQRVALHIQELAAIQQNAIEKLTELFQFLISDDFFLRRAQLYYSLGNSPEAQKALNDRQGSISENARIFSETLAAVIEQGKAAGDFRQDIATSTMLKAFISIVRAQSVKDRLAGNYEDVSPAELLQVYISGIAVQATTTK